MDLAELNGLSDADAERTLRTVCAARRWVDEVVAGRPYESAAELHRCADHVMAQLSTADLDEAIAGHPRIGAARTSEQAGVDHGDDGLLRELAEANDAYAERFGRSYLVCASGRTGPDLLALMRNRLGNDPDHEITVVRDELGKINRLRLERLVGS